MKPEIPAKAPTLGTKEEYIDSEPIWFKNTD
jgi:hypothetical protein